MHYRSGVSRRNLHRRMRRTGGGSSDQEGHLHPLSFHLGSHGHHFIQRRRDQSAQPDHIHPMRFSFRQNLLARDHHPKVDDLISVTGQHHPHDVFPNVVHIPFDRGHENPAGPGAFPRCRFLFFHEWGQIGHGLFHHPRTFHHLG